MQTKKYNITIMISCLLVAGLSSCNKNLNEYNPSNPAAGTVWSTPGGFITNVNGAYTGITFLYGSDENGMFLSEMGTDIWYNCDKGTYDQDITQYVNFTSSSGAVKGDWVGLYKFINQCNAGIGRIDGAGFTNVTEKNMREAELRFLRGLYYLWVVEQWGNVILDTVETTSLQLTAQRSPVTDFYNTIINDLQFATAWLPNTCGANTNVASGTWEYGRATKAAAWGILARAYLSRAYYATGADATSYFQKAHDAAMQVINNASTFGLSLYANYADMWDPNNRTITKNKEAIFAATYTNNTALQSWSNGNRTNLWYLTAYSGYSGSTIPGLALSIAYGNDQKNRRFMPTRSLLDLYNDTIDARYAGSFQEIWLCNKAYTWTASDVSTFKKDPSLVGHVMKIGDTALWISKHVIPNQTTRPYAIYDRDSTYDPVTGSITNSAGAKIRYVPLKKYMDPLTKTGTTTYPGYLDIFVLRLAEMYLIAAEADLQLNNNTTEAASLINVLRTRAAIKTPVDHTADMQVTPGQITLDFILDERARELCGEYQRWFDLKRTGKLASRLQAYNPDVTSFNSNYYIRPVPLSELQALTNAAQFGSTPGY